MQNTKVLLFLLILTLGCSDSSTDSQDPQLVVRPHLIRVPADALNIKTAINSADSGDTVLVADGVYTGDGNRDIDFGGKSVVVMSETGPLATIIDCGGSEEAPHRAFTLINREDGAVIDGFTIRGAYATQGSAINLKSSSPTIRNCVFVNSVATVSGGTIRCKSASPKLINCTIVGSSAPAGGAIYLVASSHPSLTNCLISFSSSGNAVGSDGSSVPALICCNLFGNIGGDWDGVIASQASVDGNLSLDPLLCSDSDYRLHSDSPCAPLNNSCGELIGALGVACD